MGPASTLRSVSGNWRRCLLSSTRGRRQEVAKELGFRVQVLDGEVAKHRDSGSDKDEKRQGTTFTLQTPEPWHEPVDGSDLLDGLAAVVRRYVVLPGPAADAIALWIVHTYAHDIAMVSPYLDIPEPAEALRENHPGVCAVPARAPADSGLQHLSGCVVQDGGGAPADAPH